MQCIPLRRPRIIRKKFTPQEMQLLRRRSHVVQMQQGALQWRCFAYITSLKYDRISNECAFVAVFIETCGRTCFVISLFLLMMCAKGFSVRRLARCR